MCNVVNVLWSKLYVTFDDVAFQYKPESNQYDRSICFNIAIQSHFHIYSFYYDFTIGILKNMSVTPG